MRRRREAPDGRQAAWCPQGFDWAPTTNLLASVSLRKRMNCLVGMSLQQKMEE